jgi:hypothetical protein
VAVKTLPVMITAQSVDRAVGVAVLVLGIAALATWSVTAMPWLHRRPVPITD